MHILSEELKEKGKILLQDAWSPVAECRQDFSAEYKDYLGEVWIVRVTNGYDCRVRWYYRPGPIRFLFGLRKYVHKKGKMEHFFGSRGGGGLKSLIRATNVYFGRNDDVDSGIHETSWEEY